MTELVPPRPIVHKPSEQETTVQLDEGGPSEVLETIELDEEPTEEELTLLYEAAAGVQPIMGARTSPPLRKPAANRTARGIDIRDVYMHKG
jgi:hypothetical protein